MSWSSLKKARLRFAARLFAGSLAAALWLGQPVCAAEYYVQPMASITASVDSNLDLEPASQGTVSTNTGYIGDAAALFGIATPDSDTTIRPRVDYREYPSDSRDDRLEEYLDLSSNYRAQRGRASLYLGYERRDELNAELNSAYYNPYAPVPPTSPETGRTQTGATRTSLILLPNYTYYLTPLTTIGVSGIYQKLAYSPDNSFDAVDFNYYQAKVFAQWALNPKNDLTVGVYGSDYEATHYDSIAVAEGASVGVHTNWTPLLDTDATVVYQHTRIDTAIPKPLRTTESPWGASFAAAYKGQVDQLRLNVDRLITPSGGGGIYVNEQAQLQYSRDLSWRLKLTGAMIVLRNHGLTYNVSGDDRTFLRTAVELKWMFTPTLYVQGGYQYMWEKYQLNPDGAADNRFHLTFGYQARNRQY
jgi:hypothetical protein